MVPFHYEFPNLTALQLKEISVNVLQRHALKLDQPLGENFTELVLDGISGAQLEEGKFSFLVV